MRNLTLPPILELGADFYDEVKPAIFPRLQLRYRNLQAGRSVGLAELSPQEWQEHMAEFKAFAGNIPHPLALRYHGHQFQHYNPDLGDGRGFLFAQFTDAKNRVLDLGTKGSGQTPYSRQGDGRLTLKGAFREILATEMLESLGVNTSKTLSVFETGESLSRHDEPSPTRGAVLVRLNHSHIRYGTFQRLAYFKDSENIKKLLNYCGQYYYPELKFFEGSELATLFLQKVTEQAARTTAQWMMAGFVHGVLNTDNMNITGESFDYGPFRFLPAYDPQFTAAYFDHQKLYCYGRQPSIVAWNLHQLGVALQSAFPELDLENILADYGDQFSFHLANTFLRRLNLKLKGHVAESDVAEKVSSLVSLFFQFMSQNKNLLFEQCFFDLHSGINEDRLKKSPQSSLYSGPLFAKLSSQLNQNFEVETQSLLEHSYFQNEKPCTMLIDELEGLWKPIAESDDWVPFAQKIIQIQSFRGVY